MIENNKDDENSNKKEEELVNDKIIKIEEYSPKSKQKIALFIIMGVLILILIITLIVVFSLKNSDEDEMNPPLIINSTSGNHTHTLIFMPGYSNTPEDFKILFTHMINFTKKNDTTFIILRSPLVDVTVCPNKNYSWFDIYTFPLANNSCYNFDELKKSAKILEKVINNEVNLLNGRYDRIIIGGHSQGACISLYQAYNSDKNIGGVISFSGILPPGDISPTKDKIETYFGYGDADDYIVPSFIVESIERISYFSGFHEYVYKNHKHYVITNETNDVGLFLENITTR